MKKILFKPTILLASLLLFTSCLDQKSPEKGYISQDEVKEIVKKFDTECKYKTYSFKGKLNFFQTNPEKVPNEVDKKMYDLIPSLDVFSPNTASYYLNLPLQITEKNYYTDELDDNDLPASTEYAVKSAIYAPKSTDTCYYYKASDGGLIIKSFAVNKGLRIVNPSNIIANAKWNVTVKYSSDGYLEYEDFQTINAHKDDDKNTIYGRCDYTYEV